MAVPIRVSHLFRPLDASLIDLLKSLTIEEWNAQTVARLWKVKDVAAHLLDGNVRTLSIQRDGFFGEQPGDIQSYQDLVAWLNQLNADWVKSSKRISPKVMILLHEATSHQTCTYYESVDLNTKAIFSVAWAGESESQNWFHIAREYTEKWLHQQQIRDAVNKPAILNQKYYSPFLETVMYALPFTFKNVGAPTDTAIQLDIAHEVVDSWYLVKRESGWELFKQKPLVILTHVYIEGHAAWKLFSKSWRAEDVRPYVKIEGDQRLGEQVLQLVSFMA
jgi:Mycothiol maleylpyruvate isomerase N-terminal domain